MLIAHNSMPQLKVLIWETSLNKPNFMKLLSCSQGSTWPALHMLAASWFPPLQRSGFISCYSGTETHGCCFHSKASTVSLTAAAVSVRPKCRPLHGFKSSWERDYDKTFHITSRTIFKFQVFSVFWYNTKIYAICHIATFQSTVIDVLVKSR